MSLGSLRHQGAPLSRKGLQVTSRSLRQEGDRQATDFLRTLFRSLKVSGRCFTEAISTIFFFLAQDSGQFLLVMILFLLLCSKSSLRELLSPSLVNYVLLKKKSYHLLWPGTYRGLSLHMELASPV